MITRPREKSIHLAAVIREWATRQPLPGRHRGPVNDTPTPYTGRRRKENAS